MIWKQSWILTAETTEIGIEMVLFWLDFGVAIFDPVLYCTASKTISW